MESILVMWRAEGRYEERGGVMRKGGVTVPPCGAGAGLSGFEHENGAWIRALQEVPGYGGPGDAAADDDGVGGRREVRRGAVVGHGVGRVLPVADCWVGAGEGDGDLGAFVHLVRITVFREMLSRRGMPKSDLRCDCLGVESLLVC
jgi:hypothetical protein